MKINNSFILFALFIWTVISVVGCQKSPEESAVVSKADGLSQDVIAKVLNDNETINIDLPSPWTASERRSNGRVLLTVDLALDPVTVGNLPVLEMKNRVISQSNLKNLVDYFAGSEALYIPYVDTKGDYQEIIDRIKGKKGAYANSLLAANYSEQVKNLEKAIEIAPNESPDKPLTEVKFQKKQIDEAEFVSANADIPPKFDMELFFNADIGDDREAFISAENYNADAGNSSIFIWQTGAEIMNAAHIQDWLIQGNALASSGNSEYYNKWIGILEECQSIMAQDADEIEKGKKQAEELLKELEISNITLKSTQEALWFPKGAFPKSSEISPYDLLWETDFEKVIAGYEYTFTRAVGGLPVDQMENSIVVNETTGTHAPPFPVEKVIIVVADGEVKSFSWEGMCEEAATVAENTNLLEFEEISDKLFQYIYYRYVEIGQPSNSKAEFEYTVTSARLGYTYVPAFKKPENAWLVPTWFFEVKVSMDSTQEGGTKFEQPTQEYMLNALDGGWIAWPS